MRAKIRLLLLILGLPLGVCLWGGSQVYRLPASWTTVDERAAKVTAVIAEASELKAKHGGGYEMLVTFYREQLMTVDEALEDCSHRQWMIVENRFWIVTAYGALGLGGLATMVALLIVLRIRGMAGRARQSPRDLLGNFSAGARQLPWFILCLAVPLYLAASCAFVSEVRGVFSDSLKGLLGALGWAVGLLIAGAILIRVVIKAVRRRVEPAPIVVMGSIISEQRAPKLWRFVREVARKVHAEMPDTILVGFDNGFFVTERAVEHEGGSIVKAGRKLYLPLPYMAFMSQDEAMAVIGHEFGHFFGEDSGYHLRAGADYDVALSRLGFLRHQIGVPLADYFIRSFDAAFDHWRRLRELAADQVGAKAAGARVSALALLRKGALAPRVNETLDLWRRRGADVDGGILGELRRRVATKGLSDPQSDLGGSLAHPFDTHLPTRERIKALQVEVTRSLLAKATAPRPSSLLFDLGLEEAPPEGAVDGDLSEADGAGLSSAVESQFSGGASDRRQERIDYLLPYAEQGRDRVPVFRSALGCRGIRWIVLILVGLSMSVGFPNLKGWAVAVPVLVWLVGLLGLGFEIWTGLRGKPMFTLTAEGVIFDASGVTVPWSSVRHLNIVTQPHFVPIMVAVGFVLHDGLTLRSSRIGPCVKYNRKYKAIVAVTTRPRGMSIRSYKELLEKCWNGGLARHELNLLGAVVP